MNLRAVLGLLLVTLVVGCATPESRIKKNPELFDALAPDVQASVMSGKISIGFPKDAVYLALGKPNREYSRTTEKGISEVWSYTATQTRTDRQRADVNVRYQDASGKMRSTREDVWVDVEQKTEYERLRVEFAEGVVSGIETLAQ